MSTPTNINTVADLVKDWHAKVLSHSRQPSRLVARSGGDDPELFAIWENSRGSVTLNINPHKAYYAYSTNPGTVAHQNSFGTLLCGNSFPHIAELIEELHRPLTKEESKPRPRVPTRLREMGVGSTIYLVPNIDRGQGMQEEFSGFGKVWKFTVKSMGTQRISVVEPTYITFNTDTLDRCYLNESDAEGEFYLRLLEMRNRHLLASERLSKAITDLERPSKGV